MIQGIIESHENTRFDRSFAEEGIEFAYPTQTVHLEGIKPGG